MNEEQRKTICGKKSKNQCLLLDFKILSLISFTNTIIIIIIIVSLVDVNFDHIDFEIVPLMDGHIVCQ